MIKVGDKVRWRTYPDNCEVWSILDKRAQLVGPQSGTTTWVVPLSELTLVESAPVAPVPAPSLVEEALKQRESLLAEVARLRQMHSDIITDLNGPDPRAAVLALADRLEAEARALRESVKEGP